MYKFPYNTLSLRCVVQAYLFSSTGMKDMLYAQEDVYRVSLNKFRVSFFMSHYAHNIILNPLNERPRKGDREARIE